MAAMNLEASGTMSTDALLVRLCEYSLSIPEYRGAVKEWPWRNGWFVKQSHARGLAMPAHEEALQKVGRVTGGAREQGQGRKAGLS